MDPLERKQQEEQRINKAIEAGKQELLNITNTINSAEEKVNTNLSSMKVVVKEASDMLMNFLQEKKKEEERLDRAIVTKTEELLKLTELAKDIRGNLYTVFDDVENRLKKIKSL